MGYQTGYILIGPRRLDDTVKIDAINSGVEALMYLRKMWSYVTFFEECEVDKFIKDNPRPPQLVRQTNTTLLTAAALCQKECFHKSIETLLKEFMEYWEDPTNYEDTMLKADPTDKDKHILFAGTICDNIPNTRGYILCSLANIFGWLKLFRIT